LRTVEAGLQSSDAPRHQGAEGPAPPRTKRGDRMRDARVPPGSAQGGPDASWDRHGYADETLQGGSAGASAQVEPDQAIRPGTPLNLKGLPVPAKNDS
jgi:hypothetical protein